MLSKVKRLDSQPVLCAALVMAVLVSGCGGAPLDSDQVIADNVFSDSYLYNTSNTCTASTAVRRYNNAFLANAYVDLGTYSGFTPYVGGGLGFKMNIMSGSLNAYETANGQPYSRRRDHD
jgi:hypothetical protein